MTHNVRGIVLWARRAREADKVVGLFTREMGRLTARVTSAARPSAKFVSLTEPFVESDLAVYLGPGQAWGKLVGGRMVQSFPSLRLGLERSTAASWICEILYRLTPEEHHNADEYGLLVEALTALETASSFGLIRLAFVVRFLGLAGFGLDLRERWLGFCREHPDWGTALLEAPLGNLGQLRWSSPALTNLEQLASGVIADYLNRPLMVNRFRQMTGVQI